MGVKSKFYFFLILSIIVTGCNNNDTALKDKTVIEKKDRGVVGLIEGKIFCVPSPYKFAEHIRTVGVPYNHTLLNPSGNKSLYESSFKKNLNFGIYGIDLAYINIFEQSSDALNYFSVLKSLSEDIGLSEIFDVETLERLENNITTQDSLLQIMALKYKAADEQLKTENQKSQAGLILAGSWIESLYILTQIEAEKPNNKTKEHIAEHMFSAKSLLEVLRPYYRTSDDYKNLVDSLVNICYEFDGIDYVYEYSQPITYPDIKKTIMTSKSSMTMYPEHLQSITNRIVGIRNNFIN